MFALARSPHLPTKTPVTAFDLLPKSVVHDGVHYAAGFCGSGVVWARWFAKKSAYRIVGNSAGAESAFDGRPFQTRMLYKGNPWFLPFVIAWYGWKDRLGYLALPSR